MFYEKIQYEDALGKIRKSRGICNPNMGYTLQLLWWYKRLYEPYNSIPIKPRVFELCSQSQSDPKLIVAKLRIDKMFIELDKYPNRIFDSRGLYIIMHENNIFIWIGPKLDNRKDI